MNMECFSYYLCAEWHHRETKVAMATIVKVQSYFEVSTCYLVSPKKRGAKTIEWNVLPHSD